MTELEPKKIWSNYMKEVEELHCAKKELSGLTYRMFALDKSAPDDVKTACEHYQTIRLKIVAKSYVPDMENPYYTWEGKIVERDSLRGRELPFAD